MEQLGGWGAYLTFKTLAKGDILRMEAVSKLSVYSVYTYLLCDKDERDYERRLVEITKNKK